MLHDREEHREGYVQGCKEGRGGTSSEELDGFKFPLCIRADAEYRTVPSLSLWFLHVIGPRLFPLPDVVRHQDLSPQPVRIARRLVFQRKGEIERGESDHIRWVEEGEVCLV